MCVPSILFVLYTWFLSAALNSNIFPFLSQYRQTRKKEFSRDSSDNFTGYILSAFSPKIYENLVDTEIFL